MAEYDANSRAEVISELQGVQAEAGQMPLQYAARELESVPLDGVLAGIEEARQLPVDSDALTTLPDVMRAKAIELFGRLSAILDGTANDTASLAALNLEAVTDHTERMVTFGGQAEEAVRAMQAALATAQAEAQKAMEMLQRAKQEAQAAITAQTHFNQAIGGYLEAI